MTLVRFLCGWMGSIARCLEPAERIRIALALVQGEEEMLVKRLSSSLRHKTDQFNMRDIPPLEDCGFVSLLPLFFSNPLNRGVVSMDIDEALQVYSVIKTLESPSGIEVGRFKGGGTLVLASAVGPHGKLTSIDINPVDDDALQEKLKAMGRPNVELYVGDSASFNYNEEIDFVCIDGDHTYAGAKSDHLKWGRLVRVGGFIIHHDMVRSRPYSRAIPGLA